VTIDLLTLSHFDFQINSNISLHNEDIFFFLLGVGREIKRLSLGKIRVLKTVTRPMGFSIRLFHC
jgi:hypothetical protein